jgi:electron transfer flavoprotein beta subunit
VKLLVPIKRVPAPETRIRVRPDGGGIVEDDIQFVVNPFDEIALEEALRLREDGAASEVLAVAIGGEECADQIRTALAMGADRAIHVDEQHPLDSRAVALLLRAVVERERPGVVVMGKQAIDDDSNQAGQMLAALLGWPQATFISRLELLDGGTAAECTRETDAGLEVIHVPLPAVLTTDLRLNEPRYVSLPGILRARSKPVARLSPADLGVDPAPRARVLSLAPPPARAAGTRVGSVEELAERIRFHFGPPK